MYSLEWVGIVDPDIFYRVFHSASIPPAGANRNRYRSAEVDALAERARSIEATAERRALCGRIQEIVARDLPYVPLWHKTNFAVFDRRLHGFELHPSGDFLSLARARLVAQGAGPP